MTTLSTHVLDSVEGTPAAGLEVTLDATGPSSTATSTDHDGRIRFESPLAAGAHTLTFATGDWFGDRPHFHPEVSVAFVVDPSQEHCHVALLLGPYSYTTYRGS